MGESVRVAAVADVPVGEGREFTVGDRVLAVFNVEGQFHAIDGICPHAGGPLAEGGLHGCILTCPWHGWQFDVSTGRHCLTERIQQTRFECRVEGDDLIVELPDQ
jgi:nitrite reductase (NADH) small subunit